MNKNLAFVCKNQRLIISAKRAIYWAAKKALLLADFHIGKVGHFRKAGLALPTALTISDIQRLEELLQEFKPKQCFFLGDLFHSDYNREFLLLKSCIEKYTTIKFVLIKGNHDIVSDQQIMDLGISAIHNGLNIGPFQLTHHPQIHQNLYNIAGHLHPGYKMHGRGKQSLSTAVFYFGKQQCIMPAFSAFSGKAFIKTKEKDVLFGIVENELIKIKIPSS